MKKPHKYRARRSTGHADLARQIRALKLPKAEHEFRFHPSRKFRFDLAWPALFIAAEVDGGTWSGGRHTRGQGFENDCEKLNLAAFYGWHVYRFTTAMVKDGRAIETLKRVLIGYAGVGAADMVSEVGE